MYFHSYKKVMQYAILATIKTKLLFQIKNHTKNSLKFFSLQNKSIKHDHVLLTKLFVMPI